MRVISILSLFGVLVAAATCGDEQRTDQLWGSIDFEWTIDEQATPALCEELAATRFEITVRNRGMVSDRYDAPCEDFAFSAPLIVANDEYVVVSRLIDDSSITKGQPVTSSMFSVQPGAATLVRVNFGADTRVEVIP